MSECRHGAHDSKTCLWCWVDERDARIVELEAENRRLQTENEIFLREKVRWILEVGNE
jgi:hypothetical protein